MTPGDAQFEAFIHREGPSLLRTAVVLSCGDAHAGEDLLQDALERCLRRWPTAKVEFPAAYVREAMARLAQRRRARRVLQSTGATSADAGPAVGDETARVDQRDALLEALRGLPPRQRVAVTLRHWEGLSEAETARAMGCTVGTVKSQTSRGLSALREEWAVSVLDHAVPHPIFALGETR